MCTGIHLSIAGVVRTAVITELATLLHNLHCIFVFKKVYYLHYFLVVLLRSPDMPVLVATLQDLKGFKDLRHKLSAQPCTCQAATGECALRRDE